MLYISWHYIKNYIKNFLDIIYFFLLWHEQLEDLLEEESLEEQLEESLEEESLEDFLECDLCGDKIIFDNSIG